MRMHVCALVFWHGSRHVGCTLGLHLRPRLARALTLLDSLSARILPPLCVALAPERPAPVLPCPAAYAATALHGACCPHARRR